MWENYNKIKFNAILHRQSILLKIIASEPVRRDFRLNCSFLCMDQEWSHMTTSTVTSRYLQNLGASITPCRPHKLKLNVLIGYHFAFSVVKKKPEKIEVCQPEDSNTDLCDTSASQFHIFYWFKTMNWILFKLLLFIKFRVSFSGVLSSSISFLAHPTPRWGWGE